MPFIAVQNPQSSRYLHIPLKPPSPSASQWATNTEGDTQPDTLPQLYPWKVLVHGGPQGSRVGLAHVPGWPRHPPS